MKRQIQQFIDKQDSCLDPLTAYEQLVEFIYAYEEVVSPKETKRKAKLNEHQRLDLEPNTWYKTRTGRYVYISERNPVRATQIGGGNYQYTASQHFDTRPAATPPTNVYGYGDDGGFMGNGSYESPNDIVDYA